MSLLEAIITLLAGIGVFMVGMKMMSDGLERSAGKGLKKMFRALSENRFVGVLVGAGVTAIIQSSSATTVMVIGFVNAGAMTLFQATSIIMGANIGTTITGLLVAFSSFNVGLYAMALAFLGVFLSMFARKDAVKTVGDVLTSLGLIFIGLSLMSGSLKNCAEIRDAFSSMFASVSFPLLLILLGMTFTALIQSSSATTGIIITLAGQGVLPLSSALFIVIGSNIGTCVTALLASIGASSNAKRASIVHLFFNLIGAVFFGAITWIFTSPVVTILETLTPGTLSMQIALFHIFFNVITTALLLPFARPLARLAEKIIPEKKTKKQTAFSYIDERMIENVPIALDQTAKEVERMGALARDNLFAAFDLLRKKEGVNESKILADIADIDAMHNGISHFLVKLSAHCGDELGEESIGALHQVNGDMERIASYAELILKRAKEMDKAELSFSLEAQEELDLIKRKVEAMFEATLPFFFAPSGEGLKRVLACQEEVTHLKKTLNDKHVERLNRGDCSVEKGIYFYATLSEFERTAVHLGNVAQALSPFETMKKEPIHG